MIENLNNKYCLLNYSSKLSADGKQSYEFWYCHRTIKIISEDGRPFSRGDIAKVVEVNEVDDLDVNPLGPYILVNVVGDPHIDRIPKEVTDVVEIPTLLFVRTTIFLNEMSEYVFETDGGVDILLAFSTVIDRNMAYAAAALVSGDRAKIKAVDKHTQNQFEWLIVDKQENRSAQ